MSQSRTEKARKREGGGGVRGGMCVSVCETESRQD